MFSNDVRQAVRHDPDVRAALERMWPVLTPAQVLANAQTALILGNWWWAFFPGMAIALTVIAINFIGDGLRDALDPRSRE